MHFLKRILAPEPHFLHSPFFKSCKTEGKQQAKCLECLRITAFVSLPIFTAIFPSRRCKNVGFFFFSV